MTTQIISWSNKSDLKETEKAIGVKITHNQVTKYAWFPKSQIININKETKILEIPEWLYDKKIEDLFGI